MWIRTLTGLGALGVYGWRVHDPKTSYGVFFDVSDWFTSFIVSSEGAWVWVRNAINLILIDQADGFLLGMAFFALVSILLWPVRVCGRACVRGVQRIIRPRAAREGADGSSR
ncbi:MAG: hypothetical protein AAF409_05240 [Pseudomonadota bacterium]